jgi:hypothetical protein
MTLLHRYAIDIKKINHDATKKSKKGENKNRWLFELLALSSSSSILRGLFSFLESYSPPHIWSRQVSSKPLSESVRLL